MKYADESYNLRIELDTKNCECSADEIGKMEKTLDSLAEVARDFPVSDLYITIVHHPPSNDYHVKTSLVLPGRILFTGERGDQILPAYEDCIGKLVRKVQAYKDRMENVPEHTRIVKGTHHEIVPSATPDHEEISTAVKEGDYAKFRRATYMYEESVRKRIGRWIQRYPELEASLGRSFDIRDIVEEVFLLAFDEHAQKPAEVPPGDWLESLIDPAIQLLIRHPDEELANISMARSLQETDTD